MGLLESFRFLSKSKYLGFVGLIVLSYGLSMEFTEIVWKVCEENETAHRTSTNRFYCCSMYDVAR